MDFLLLTPDLHPHSHDFRPDMVESHGNLRFGNENK
jgi:hypothetical protein